MLRYSIFFFFSFIQLFSQNQYSEGGQRDGLWKGYYDNGQLRYEGVFNDGKETGVFKNFLLDGNLPFTNPKSNASFHILL